MGSIIVDTSVWIDCFRGVQNEQTKLVADLLMLTKRVAITPTILQEILQGVREDSQLVSIRASLLACTVLSADPVEAAVGAADLYRALRKKGITIRKPNDCLIAYYAISFDLPILHNDIDFEQIAHYSSLRIAGV